MVGTTSFIRERSPLELVRSFAARGDAPALLSGAETLSYGELDRRVDAAVDRLGNGRKLVVLQMSNAPDPVIWYLAALRGRHPVLLTGDDDAVLAGLVERYDPDVVIRGTADGSSSCAEFRRQLSAHDLHPDLALLLSTSGSTGSPKLVRLSHDNLQQNAASIAEYLGLCSTDRAMTSLPLHYCYGLSVLHSHLLVGGSVVLTDGSVVDPCFWDTFRRTGATSFAGVPYTFELLDRVDFPSMSLPSLRTVTQAGGRLDPEIVQRYAALAQRDGWELYVMYGQTEATARMAYLPPQLAATRPDAIGVPVPGGQFCLEPVDGLDDARELVYRGPNVMLGYAEDPADLALGATLEALRTGDLARRGPDGLYELVGRRSRFLKLCGLRVDLDRVAQSLADDGIAATCTGDDDGLVVAVEADEDPGSVRRRIVDGFGLPPSKVAVVPVDELPRLPNGKPDHPAIRALARSTPEPTSASGGSVHAVFARVLDRDEVLDGDTFVSLGGDSLSYVEMSIALEERLGHLPDGWHITPVGDLVPSSRRRGLFSRVETNVVVRAIAIVLIVANHTGVFMIGGGAHVLFAAAGFNFARFQLEGGSLARSTLRLAVPSMVWIGAVAALREDFDLAHALLLHGWIGGPGRWAYWFVEALVQVLVVVGIVLAVPRLRALERRHRFGFPAAALAAALLVRFDIIDFGVHHRPYFRPHEILWIFLLGWLTAQADTVARRSAVSAVVLFAVPGFFGGNTVREAVLAFGVLALLWIPRLVLLRPLAKLTGTLAAASLYVYLTHFQVHPLLSDRFPVLGLVASILVGVAVWSVAQPLVLRGEARCRRRVPRIRSAIPERLRPSRA